MKYIIIISIIYWFVKIVWIKFCFYERKKFLFRDKKLKRGLNFIYYFFFIFYEENNDDYMVIKWNYCVFIFIVN